jgi:hypothetical protein
MTQSNDIHPGTATVTSKAGHTYTITPKLDSRLFIGWEITDPDGRKSIAQGEGDALHQGCPQEVEDYICVADDARSRDWFLHGEHFPAKKNTP